ncbi:MAG: 16S rRNA (guanine(966)-N(2))-methyltransferase RsmD [bacterium]
MRVIAGLAKGRLLCCPKGKTIRPTSDRVKEALFNIIINWVDGAQVLDLFAGTGSLGIEALSRGARQAIFVDRDQESIKLIKKNLERTGLLAQAIVYRKDALVFLQYIARKGNVFDLIFSDPPYGKVLANRIIQLVAGGSLLHSAGLLIVEHSPRESLPAQIMNLGLWQQRSYGDTVLSFYRCASGEELLPHPKE